MNAQHVPQPLAHSPESAARILSIPTRSVYLLMERGELRSFKLGRRRLIADSECRELVRRLSERGTT